MAVPVACNVADVLDLVGADPAEQRRWRRTRRVRLGPPESPAWAFIADGVDVVAAGAACASVTFPAGLLDVQVRVEVLPDPPNPAGVTGRCWSGRDIVIAAHRDAAVSAVAMVAAHELGHAYDRQRLRPADHRRFVRALGRLPVREGLWADRRRPWDRRYSECYAECFARRWAPAQSGLWRFGHWLSEPDAPGLAARPDLDAVLNPGYAGPVELAAKAA